MAKETPATKVTPVCPIDAPGDPIAQVLSEWNDIASDVEAWYEALIRSKPQDSAANLLEPGLFSLWRSPRTHIELGRGVFFVAGSFFIVDPASDMIWPTIHALPYQTLGADTRRTG